MRKLSFTTLLALGIAAASLSSCSRANYAFNPKAPSYLGSKKVHAVAPAATVAKATTPKTSPIEAAPAHQSIAVVTPRSVPTPVAKVPKEMVQPVPVAPAVVATNASAVAKPSLMQRGILKGLAKKLDKMQRKQSTADTQNTASKKGQSLIVALGGLGLAIIGLIIAGGSLSGGSGAGVAAGVILYYVGLIAFIVGVVLLVIHLVNGD